MGIRATLYGRIGSCQGGGEGYNDRETTPVRIRLIRRGLDTLLEYSSDIKSQIESF